MGVAEIVIGAILLVLSVLMVVVILQQTGKEKGLSGSISGGSSDTYFGKSGGSTKEKLLFRVTVVASVLFVALAVTLTILVMAAK